MINKFKRILDLLNITDENHVRFLTNSAEKIFSLDPKSHYSILYLMAGYDANILNCSGVNELGIGDNLLSYGQYVATADWKETYEDFKWHASSLIRHTTVNQDFIDDFFEMEDGDEYGFILEEFDLLLNAVFEYSLIKLDTHSDQYVYTIVKNENKIEVMKLFTEIFLPKVMTPREF